MKLQPYRQVSVSGHMQSKLNPKYYGHYEILEKVGTVAYKLNLPIGSSIHPVIHVSQLKIKKGEGAKICDRLPVVGPDGEVRIEPWKILDRRVIKRRNEPKTQLLIQWFNKSKELATWEDYETIKEDYPHFILEDKNLIMRGAVSDEYPTADERSAAEIELGAVAGLFDLVKQGERGEKQKSDGKREGSLSGLQLQMGPQGLIVDGVKSVNEGTTHPGANTCP